MKTKWKINKRHNNISVILAWVKVFLKYKVEKSFSVELAMKILYIYMDKKKNKIYKLKAHRTNEKKTLATYIKW